MGHYSVVQQHPRLLLNNGVLERLREYACVDNNGNIIAGCTPSERWNNLIARISLGNLNDWGRQAWHYALIYKVNQNTAYRDAALTKLNQKFSTFITDARFDSRLLGGDEMRNLGLVYDWLFDDLDNTTKQKIVAYMNQAAYETKNGSYGSTCPCALSGGCPNPDPAHPYSCSWNGWSLDNPRDNYHYAHLMEYTYNFLATAGENPDASIYMDELYNAIHRSGGVLDTMARFGVGGGWIEGSSYNFPTKNRMINIFSVIQSATTTDYFIAPEAALLRDLPLYQMFLIQPGNFSSQRFIAPFGDLARDSAMAMNDFEWMLIGAGPRYAPASQTQRFAQYFRTHSSFGGSLIESGWNAPEDFMTFIQGAPEEDFRSLLSYHAEGAGFVNTRSSWDDDGVSVTFMSGCYLNSHQNQDQNTFLIYKNGWQIADNNTYTDTGIIHNTLGENTMLINGQGQNGLSTEPEDCASISKFAEFGDFTFSEGDAVNVYSALDAFKRQLVFVRPNMLLVHDKVTAKNAAYSKQSLLHFGSAPVVSGDIITGTQGSGRVFVKVLLPEAASISVVSDGDIGGSSYRAIISPSTSQLHDSFLNVFEVVDSTKDTMDAMTSITSTTSNMEGVQLSNRYVVMFSSSLNTITSSIFSVSDSAPITLLLVDLVPNAYYTVSRAGTTISINSGGSSRASEHGVLRVDLE